MLTLVAALLAVLAAIAVLLARQVHTLLADVEALGERVQELTTRLEVAEHDVSGAIARTEAAETVLVEKGLADEEELEAARRRSGGDATEPCDDREIH